MWGGAGRGLAMERGEFPQPYVINSLLQGKLALIHPVSLWRTDDLPCAAIHGLVVPHI